MMKHKKTLFAIAIAVASSGAIAISSELRELILEVLRILQNGSPG